jgi:peroxiredoxin
MLAVGDRAPDFRLPSAQGGEVALGDYRGKQNVIVWFTKGMACIFCRQHMTQLARIAPELSKRKTHVLEVTPTSESRGRVYAAKYRLPFPYLLDPDDRVRATWHLDVRRRGPLWYAIGMVVGMTMEKPKTDFGEEGPALSEMPTMLRDEDMGFFIVDREGVIRYAYGGAYVTQKDGRAAIRPIPSSEEVLRELDRFASAA